MSFWPLARTITDPLHRAAARGPLVELGAGDGRFTRRLRELELNCWALDLRYPPAPSESTALAADAQRLPFADRTLGALLAPNLLRQMQAPTMRSLAQECARVLKPGGYLVVLEDEPDARDEAERNYRDCLLLLAQRLPERGPGLLSAEACEECLLPVLGPPVAAGLGENAERVQDPMMPLQWLLATGNDRRSVEELGGRVRRHGMHYGRFWYRVFHRDEAAG